MNQKNDTTCFPTLVPSECETAYSNSTKREMSDGTYIIGNSQVITPSFGDTGTAHVVVDIWCVTRDGHGLVTASDSPLPPSCFSKVSDSPGAYQAWALVSSLASQQCLFGQLNQREIQILSFVDNLSKQGYSTRIAIDENFLVLPYYLREIRGCQILLV